MRAHASPLLGLIGAHLRFAVQPALVVGPVGVVADPCQQGLDVLAVVNRVRLEEQFLVVCLHVGGRRHSPRTKSRTAAG